MTLCLDCGNSRLKWGLREDGKWSAQGALDLGDLPLLASFLPPGIDRHRAIGCNVAGEERAKAIAAALPMPVVWADSRAAQCSVVNGYDDPAGLGADRWAALIGARALHRGAALVVIAGTATTIDLLDADGRFLGGLILPGLTLMAQSLAQGTAQLPAAQGVYRPLPRNTHDAIASGAVHATLGAVQRMFDQLPPGSNTLCLLSGGAAETLQPHIALPLRRVENLVLEGLATMVDDPSFPAA